MNPVNGEKTPHSGSTIDANDVDFAGMSNADLGIVNLEDIKVKPVDWLLKYRFARGELALMAGEGGLGKSLFLLQMGAAISTGGSWPEPGAGNAPLGTVVILSAEDLPETTIKPRLIAMGANENNIKILKAKYIIRKPDKEPKVHPVSLQDLAYWKTVLDRLPNTLFSIVDPLPSYLGCGVNDAKNWELRQIIEPFIEEILRPRGICMAGNTHLNKNIDQKTPIFRILDSVSYSNLARNVHFVVRDWVNPDRRFFKQAKCNNAPDDLPAIAYRIEKKIVPSDSGDIETVIPVFEAATVDISLSDHLNGPGSRPGPVATAIPRLARFLLGFMKEKGPVLLGEIAQAAGEAGLLGKHKDGKWTSFTFLYRAVDAMPQLPPPDDGWKIVTSKDEPDLLSVKGKARWQLRRANSAF